MKVVLHWFRRDLRLHDNTALHAAAASADAVITVYIFDPEVVNGDDFGAPRAAFLLESMKVLGREIELAGGNLVLRRGKPEEELQTLIKETGAHEIYFNQDYEPKARKRDTRIEKVFRDRQVAIKTFKDDVIQGPSDVLKADGKPYEVFTAYQRIWRAKGRNPVLSKVKFAVQPVQKCLKSLPFPTLKDLGFILEVPPIPAGELAGRDRLKQFSRAGALTYATNRDFPACEGTSRLSPHLAFGTLSPRTVLAVIEKAAEAHPPARKELDIFVNELIWRDFYRQILWHFPHVATSAFKPQGNEIAWENNEKHFAAWCEGRTGYPIVDAGMRQLNTTGWMHNRVRMIVATFLTKDLLVSWQWGERYFMRKLYDADLASNNGGWQWCASTGTDAQPYFRIFNPTAQARKFDPEGRYIRQYVPEADLLSYPAPIVDHAQQRLKALAMFRRG